MKNDLCIMLGLCLLVMLSVLMGWKIHDDQFIIENQSNGSFNDVR